VAEPVLALEILYENVKARFAAEAPLTAVVFGWREPPKQVNQGATRANRIAFVPGADLAMGDYASARSPGRNPRPLGTLVESCTVYCWAADLTDANNELAQWRAARLLHDGAYRACQLALRTKAIANLLEAKFSKPEWIRPNLERTFGAELRFVLSLGSMIPDTPFDETGDLDGPVRPGLGAYLDDEQDSTDIVIPEEES
jgi:hypothetical protein